MLCSRPPPSTSALSKQSEETPWRAKNAESPSGCDKGPKITARRGVPLGDRWRTRRTVYAAQVVRLQRRCLIATAVPAVDPHLRRRAAQANPMVAAHFAKGRAFR
eukprot:5342741-Pleurochrysis_carterae.AAC.1